MKKVFTLLAMLSLFLTGAQAQWTTSDTNFITVGEQDVYDQSGLKSLLTPEGNIVFTWLEWPNGMSKKDPESGYRLHMQIYDKYGNAKFASGGILICEQPTATFTSDYGLTIASNGDIVLGYFDTRNDATREQWEVYAYRYTQDGQPVWSQEGIHFSPTISHTRGFEMAPSVIASGDYIYFGCNHTEYYNVKADSTNWTPNPRFPDQEMPDSIQVSSTTYQVQCLNADGSFLWDSPLTFEHTYVWLYPAMNNSTYVVYGNSGYGLDAQLIDLNGKNTWETAVNVEHEALTSSTRMSTPSVEPDGEGGLILSYRRLTDWNGYIVMNRLCADGTVFEEPVLCNGTTEGEGNYPQIGVKDNHAVIAWQYELNEPCMMVNQFTIDGDYVWEGDSLLGYSISASNNYGITPLKIIAQENGWVLIYGDKQSWNGQNLFVEKIDDNGHSIWKKQVASDNFKTNDLIATADNQRAYILCSCKQETDENGEEITGFSGLRLLVVDITDITNSASSVDISESSTMAEETYNTQGIKISHISAPGVYLVKSGDRVHKILKK